MSKQNIYGKPRDGELTQKQWNIKGYQVKDGEQGRERWFGLTHYPCYTESQVTYVGAEAIKEQQRAKRRAADKERRERLKAEREADEQESDRMADIMLNTHTAHQWLTEYNRIPLDSAEWRAGNPKAGQSENYYYCHLSDTREPQSDEELASVIERERQAYEQGEYYNGKMLAH